ncbi:MAG: polysaccharide deacetylase family protein [Pseudomonadota bacterium]
MHYLVVASLAACVSACAVLPAPGGRPAEPEPRAALARTALHPIRFLLTFDDGPSAAEQRNPTVQVLDTLDHNRIQPGVKAIFFIQTRAPNGGGSERGRQLLRREYEQGHVLAFHSATPGHSNHRYLSPEALELSLQRGVADLEAAGGGPPKLVRPPFWNYDARTLDAYHRHGMQMLLTDLSANDGKIWGVNFSWHKRSNMLEHLALVRGRWIAGTLPLVDGAHPVVVTFHDVNSYTARHLEQYMEILVDVARELELPTTTKPFYDQRGDIERAALARAVRDAASAPALPGFWNWLWK